MRLIDKTIYYQLIPNSVISSSFNYRGAINAMAQLMDSRIVTYTEPYKLNTSITNTEHVYYQLMIQKLKEFGIYREDKKREPIRLPQNCTVDTIKIIRNAILNEFIPMFIESFEEFKSANEIRLYVISKEPLENFLKFYDIDQFFISNHIKMSTVRYEYKEMFRPINLAHKNLIDLAIVKNRDVTIVYLPIDVKIKEYAYDNVGNVRKIEFDRTVIILPDKLYETPEDFKKILVKTDDIESNMSEIEYYLNQKIFYEMLHMKDGQIIIN